MVVNVYCLHADVLYSVAMSDLSLCPLDNMTMSLALTCTPLQEVLQLELPGTLAAENANLRAEILRLQAEVQRLQAAAVSHHAPKTWQEFGEN